MVNVTTRMPAMALVDAEGRVLAATDSFRSHHAEAKLPEESFPELGLVLSGQSDLAGVTIDESEFTIEPAEDRAGMRRAMLTMVEPDDDAEDSDDVAAADPVTLLQEALDASPAIAWLKDLEGRYTYVNQPWTEELGTTPEQIVGQTDEALAPLDTVDGPRVNEGQQASPEPRQLEYTVPALEGRPAFAALRFVVLDGDGQSAAVCGVAAPLDRAQLAREEAGRLMRIQRWSRMSPQAIRSELLEDWGVTPGSGGAIQEVKLRPAPDAAPIPVSSPDRVPADMAEWVGDGAAIAAPDPELDERWDTCIQQLASEAGRWRTELNRARAVVGEARAEANATRAELEQLRAERDELERALTHERERGQAVVQALGQVRARIADLDSTVDQALTTEVNAT